MKLRYEGSYRWFYITPPYLYETSYGAYYFVLEYQDESWNLVLSFNEEWVVSEYQDDYDLRNIDLTDYFAGHHKMFPVYSFSPYEEPEFDLNDDEFDERLLLLHADFYAERVGKPVFQNMLKDVLERLQDFIDKETARSAEEFLADWFGWNDEDLYRLSRLATYLYGWDWLGVVEDNTQQVGLVYWLDVNEDLVRLITALQIYYWLKEEGFGAKAMLVLKELVERQSFEKIVYAHDIEVKDFGARDFYTKDDLLDDVQEILDEHGHVFLAGKLQYG